MCTPQRKVERVNKAHPYTKCVCTEKESTVLNLIWRPNFGQGHRHRLPLTWQGRFHCETRVKSTNLPSAHITHTEWYTFSYCCHIFLPFIHPSCLMYLYTFGASESNHITRMNKISGVLARWPGVSLDDKTCWISSPSTLTKRNLFVQFNLNGGLMTLVSHHCKCVNVLERRKWRFPLPRVTQFIASFTDQDFTVGRCIRDVRRFLIRTSMNPLYICWRTLDIWPSNP